MRIYLAGPIAAESDGGARWRDALVEDYPDIDWLNPLDQYNVPATDVDIVDGRVDDREGVVSVRDLVQTDKRLLRQADGVLVGYRAVQSIGTPMEVMASWRDDRPVSMWIRDRTPLSRISPWYRYHCDQITNDRQLAVGYLQRRCGQ